LVIDLAILRERHVFSAGILICLARHRRAAEIILRKPLSERSVRLPTAKDPVALSANVVLFLVGSPRISPPNEPVRPTLRHLADLCNVAHIAPPGPDIHSTTVHEVRDD
jgi:hypothetical protein